MIALFSVYDFVMYHKYFLNFGGIIIALSPPGHFSRTFKINLHPFSLLLPNNFLYAQEMQATTGTNKDDSGM